MPKLNVPWPSVTVFSCSPPTWIGDGYGSGGNPRSAGVLDNALQRGGTVLCAQRNPGGKNKDEPEAGAN